MYQFYLEISKINEKVNTTFISLETLTSYFDVALNKRNAGQGSVFYVCSFSSGLPLTFKFWKSRLPGCQFWKSRKKNLEVWYFEG